MTKRDFSERVISQIDKDRRTTAQKSRDKQTRDDAYCAARSLLLSATDQGFELVGNGILDAVRDVWTARKDAAGASSAIASRAQQAILIGGTRRSAADQAFAKLYKAPANDVGGEE
jgi:hypothetical protein